MLSSYLHGRRHQILRDDRLYKQPRIQICAGRIGSGSCTGACESSGSFAGSLTGGGAGSGGVRRFIAESPNCLLPSPETALSLENRVRPIMAPDSSLFAILASFRCKCYSTRRGQMSTPFFVGSIRSRGGLINYVLSASIVFQQRTSSPQRD